MVLLAIGTFWSKKFHEEHLYIIDFSNQLCGLHLSMFILMSTANQILLRKSLITNQITSREVYIKSKAIIEKRKFGKLSSINSIQFISVLNYNFQKLIEIGRFYYVLRTFYRNHFDLIFVMESF